MIQIIKKLLLLIILATITQGTFAKVKKTNSKLKGSQMVIGAPLFEQLGSLSGNYVPSTIFSFADIEKFTSATADDFIIPTGETWKIQYIKYTVYTSYSFDKMDGLTVKFYSDNNGKPGDIIQEYNNEFNFTIKANTEVSGIYDIIIKLSETANFSIAGKYWLSVQAETSIEEEVSGTGLPAWNMGVMLQSSNEDINSQAHIINQGGGYYWYQNWTSMSTHWITQEGEDKGIHNTNFALYGTDNEYDLSIEDISYPESGDLTALNNLNIKFIIQNHGTSNVAKNNYQVRYAINGNWITPESGELDINSGSEVEYTFRTTTDISTKDIYDVDVEVIFAQDAYTSDNFFNKTIINYGTIYSAVANSKVEFTACEGTFTDNAGLLPTELSYTHDTVVFYPATAGNRIQLKFNEIAIVNRLQFEFYNGSSTNAPLLGKYYTDEVIDLEVNASNSEGALTIVLPVIDAGFNFFADVACVPMVNNEFSIRELSISKHAIWEGEEIELTAELENRGLVAQNTLVTFFINNAELSTVSSTLTNQGEFSMASIKWIPSKAGTFNIKATIPADDANNPEDKIYALNYEVYPYGTLVEGFENGVYPPEGWVTKSPGLSSLKDISIISRNEFNWEGKKHVSCKGDTLITPKLNIAENDSISFIYSTGYHGAPISVLYASNINGPWTFIGKVTGPWIIPTDNKISLETAIGENYIAFAMGGDGEVDFIRGPKLAIEDFDLVALDLTTENNYLVGQENTYTFEIRNRGLNNVAADNYSVELWHNVDSIKIKIDSIQGKNIAAGNYQNFIFKNIFDSVSNSELFAVINYANDINVSNNISETKPIYIFETGTEFLYLGDENSNKSINFPLGANLNYSEVVFDKNDIGSKGLIYGISVYIKGINVSKSNLKIFIGETDISGFRTQFLSTANMFKAYDGILDIPFTNGEFQEIYIEFDKPYLYSGDKNISMAFYQDKAGSGLLKGTQTSNFVQRRVLLQSHELNVNINDSLALNSKSFALAPASVNETPNVQFHIKTKNMDALLSGVVTNNSGDYLPGTTMSLNNFINTTLVNDSGYYEFPVMPYGDVDITATKFGYYTQIKTGTLSANSTTEVNFIMQELSNVAVKGVVYGNDLLQPLSNVEVFLTGYNNTNAFAITDSNGNYELKNIYGDKSYQLVYSHPKYISDTIIVEVPYQGLTVDSVILDEIEKPAFNLQAILNNQGNVELSWQKPYSGIESLLDPTKGTTIYSYWYNEPNEDVQLGNYFKVENPGTVTSIEIMNFVWGTGPFSTTRPDEAELFIRFYNKDRIEILDEVSFMMPVDTTDWFTVDVPDFSYTDDFYVMIHWDEIHEQTAGLGSHITNDNVAWVLQADGSWTLLNELPGVDPKHHGSFSIKANTLEETGKASKELVSYNLWRSDVSSLSDQNRWIPLNAEPIVDGASEVTFTDNSFADLPESYYIYMLEANYSLGTAPIMYSNDVLKGMMVTTAVSVSANNGITTNGVEIDLINTNGLSINSYNAIVENDSVYFPRVLKGTYSLRAKKGSTYQPFAQTITIESDTIFNIELIEKIYSPDNLIVNVFEDEQRAEFSWGIGEFTRLIYDDATFEEGLIVQPGEDGAIGNIFETEGSGQILNVRVFGIEDVGNQGGKVRVVFYDVATEKFIGQTDQFELKAGFWTDIAIDNFAFSGPFYAMVTWESTETLKSHGLGIDINSNPGNGYYWDPANGFVLLADLGFYGNAGVRTDVLIGGKKSALLPKQYTSKNIDINNTVLSEIDVKQTVVAANSSSVLFNIYLEDMSAPIITNLQSNSVIFTNQQLNVPGVHTYRAGVQSVYATGESTVIPIDFTYNNDGTDVADSKLSELMVYPNPATNKLTIKTAQNGVIKIYNALGSLVYVNSETSIINVIDISKLDNGSYIIQVQRDQKIEHRNLIIQR